MGNKSIKQSFIEAIERMLQSVVSFALSRSILYPELETALRRAAISVVNDRIKENALEEGKQSISAIAVMTGLQRKQVKDCLSEALPQQNETILTKVIGQWCTHPDFCSAPNKPSPLSTLGTESEFFHLVSSLTSDVSPYSVLKAMEQSGIVLRKGNKVHLKVQSNITTDAVKALEFMSLDFYDLVQAVSENIQGDAESPNLHATTVYDNVCVDALPELREWILLEGSKFHEELRKKISQFDKDANPTLHKKHGGARVVVTAFSRVELPKNQK